MLRYARQKGGQVRSLRRRSSRAGDTHNTHTGTATTISTVSRGQHGRATGRRDDRRERRPWQSWAHGAQADELPDSHEPELSSHTTPTSQVALGTHSCKHSLSDVTTRAIGGLLTAQPPFDAARRATACASHAAGQSRQALAPRKLAPTRPDPWPANASTRCRRA